MTRSTTYSRHLSLLFIGVWLLATPTLATALDCCSVNGGTCNIIPPLTHGQSGWTGGVCGTTLSGVNCVAKLDDDVEASGTSTNCLTLGSGVTLDLDGYSITCTDPEFCGYAITNTTSSGGSGAVVITNGSITGPWWEGVHVSGGSQSSVSDLVLDGSVVYGLYNVRKNIDRVVIKNVSTGIHLWPGSDVKDSAIRNCDSVGIYTGEDWDDYSSSDFDNLLMVNNEYHFLTACLGPGAPTIQRSELIKAGTCDVEGWDCAVEPCLDVINTTTPSLIGNVFLP